jgi:hypothetical protein
VSVADNDFPEVFDGAPVSAPYWFNPVAEAVTALTAAAATAPRGIMAAPTTSVATGTATAASTVEVKDAVLGDYTFTAVAGRRYRVHYHGAMGNSDTVNCRMLTRIRDGGASSPGIGSTLIAEVSTYLTETGTGSAGRASFDVLHTFTATAGTHILAAFTQSPDSAIMTPVSTGAGRELYVEDIGAA